MPGVDTRYFDLEPRLPGLVDAKGTASPGYLFNPQPSTNIPWERGEKKLSHLFLPSLNLNKACTSA